ncbi:universal stress protein [Sinobaca sp. H24]|uniref:universal stress protein n=1 Tax=Sinobaca sp. H24 TaxID=2923376 RepID=UPI00207A455A|nr:universal stress protein [Sinobaca sp. H24]
MSAIYHTILAAVDGSEEGYYAFRKAVSLAGKEGAELIICTVVDERSYTGIEYSPAIFAGFEKYAKTLLAEYKTQAQEAGVTKVTTSLEFGSPRVKIPKSAAPKFNVDLIIAGAAGTGAVERLILGSVSEHIVRRASCDVLIVRKKKGYEEALAMTP